MRLSHTSSRVACARALVFLVCVFFLAVMLITPCFAKTSYKKIFKQVSRHEEVYGRDDFYASLNWYATYQDAAFLSAKVDKIARIYDYDSDRKSALWQAERKNLDKYHRFFVCLYTYEYKYGDLTSHDTVWELVLDVDGEKIKPEKIELIPKVDPLTQSLFPYSNIWSRHFEVLFPKKNHVAGVPLRLQINGPFGRSVLKW